MADPFSGFELLPADGIEVGSDEALEAALGNPPDLPDDQPEQMPLGRGWAFDHEIGQFVRVGSAPAVVYGLDNLKVWIEKTLRTARFAHPIYSDEYGLDHPFDLIGTNLTSPAVGAYTSSIRDALLVHDRISSVTDFMFTVDDDVLLVSFTVLVDTGDTLPINPIALVA